MRFLTQQLFSIMTSQEILPSSSLENLETIYGIHFPPEWKEFYDIKTINTNKLGTSIPFGPSNWTCISADNIFRNLKGYTMTENETLINHIINVLNHLVEMDEGVEDVENDIMLKLQDILESSNTT